jgi:arylsulfatase A-like enzyme
MVISCSWVVVGLHWTSLVDTAPTVLDLAGLSIPDLKQSRDRKGAVLVGVPPVRGKAWPSQDHFAAEYQGRSMLAPEPRMALFFTDYSLPLLGLRDGPWKFIYRLDTRRPKLFNLDRDPGEQSDLVPAYPDRVAWYEQLVRNWSASQRDYLAVNRGP